MYKYFGVVLKFGKMLMACIRGFFVDCPNSVCQCLPSILWKFGIW